MTTTDDDSNIATAVLNDEMDVASAVEALGEMTDAELKRELLSAAIVGGVTLLERRRSSSDDESESDADATADADRSTAVDVEAVEGESADTDASPDSADEEDADSGSRLVTLPRLALVGVAAGGAYAAMKYRRRSQSDTSQATFEDVTDDVDEETDAGGHEADVDAGDSDESSESDTGGNESGLDADADDTDTDTDEDDTETEPDEDEDEQ